MKAPLVLEVRDQSDQTLVDRRFGAPKEAGHPAPAYRSLDHSLLVEALPTLGHLGSSVEPCQLTTDQEPPLSSHPFGTSLWESRLLGISGGGHLYIGLNVLVCELGPTAKRVSGIESVHHKGGHVQIYKARLVPFWFNVSVLIDDGRNAVGASMWSFGLHSLVNALTAGWIQGRSSSNLVLSGSHIFRQGRTSH